MLLGAVGVVGGLDFGVSGAAGFSLGVFFDFLGEGSELLFCRIKEEIYPATFFFSGNSYKSS